LKGERRKVKSEKGKRGETACEEERGKIRKEGRRLRERRLSGKNL